MRPTAAAALIGAVLVTATCFVHVSLHDYESWGMRPDEGAETAECIALSAAVVTLLFLGMYAMSYPRLGGRHVVGISALAAAIVAQRFAIYRAESAVGAGLLPATIILLSAATSAAVLVQDVVEEVDLQLAENSVTDDGAGYP